MICPFDTEIDCLYEDNIDQNDMPCSDCEVWRYLNDC